MRAPRKSHRSPYPRTNVFSSRNRLGDPLSPDAARRNHND